MKPQPQPGSILVLRHVHDFCASPASFRVFSLSLRAFPRPLPSQQTDAVSNPTNSSHYDTGLPPSLSQLSTIQIP
jgi:hypothetical protein